MRRLIALLMITCMSLGGCSTPDGDDMRPLVDAVGSMPPGERYYLDALRDFDAVGRLRDENPDRPVADVYCGPDDRPTYTMLMKHLYHHLKDYVDEYRRGAPDITFGEYLHTKLAESGCRADFMPYADFTANLDLGDRFPPQDDRSNRDTAEWLVGLSVTYIKEHPVLMGIIGVILVGGALVVLPASGIGLALCPLSDAIECPGSSWLDGDQ